MNRVFILLLLVFVVHDAGYAEPVDSFDSICSQFNKSDGKIDSYFVDNKEKFENTDFTAIAIVVNKKILAIQIPKDEFCSGFEDASASGFFIKDDQILNKNTLYSHNKSREQFISIRRIMNNKSGALVLIKFRSTIHSSYGSHNSIYTGVLSQRRIDVASIFYRVVIDRVIYQD